MQADTHDFEYPLAEPLEVNTLIKEFRCCFLAVNNITEQHQPPCVPLLRPSSLATMFVVMTPSTGYGCWLRPVCCLLLHCCAARVWILLSLLFLVVLLFFQ